MTRGSFLNDPRGPAPSAPDRRAHWLKRVGWLLLLALVVMAVTLLIVDRRVPEVPTGDSDVVVGEPVPHGPPAEGEPPE